MIDRQRRQAGGGRADRLGWSDAEIRADDPRWIALSAEVPLKGGIVRPERSRRGRHRRSRRFRRQCLAALRYATAALHWPVLGKGARLHGKIDVAETIERPIAGGITRPSDLYGGVNFDLAKVKDGESETVARTEIFRRRSNFADAEQGAAGWAERAVRRACPLWPDAQLAADGHDPVRRSGDTGRLCRSRRRRRQVTGKAGGGRDGRAHNRTHDNNAGGRPTARVPNPCHVLCGPAPLSLRFAMIQQ